MKKLIITFTLFFLGIIIFAQTGNIFYTQGLSTEDKSLVKKAQADIQRGDRLIKNAQKIYNQYKALLESSKRSKQRKGEKKTVNGKKYLQQAAFYYDRGYQQLFEVYFNYVGNLKYQIDENKIKAQRLRSNAENSFTQGQKILKSIKNYTEKDFKSKVKFKDLQRKVDQGKDKVNTAVELLLQAISLYNNESKQLQQLKQQDDQAWQNALNTNTIEAYEQYLAQYPNGRHVTEARTKIDQLKQRQTQQQDSTYLDYTNYTKNPTLNLVYRIQILADKKPWTESQIRSKVYSSYGRDGNPTHRLVLNGWYKYYIGEYKTYNQAKSVANSLRTRLKTKPFVVAFLNGEPIDIKQAIRLEQQR